jgi:hypothetical protein
LDMKIIGIKNKMERKWAILKGNTDLFNLNGF